MVKQELSGPIAELINQVIQLFYYETKIQPIEFRLEFVQDLYIRKLELATNDKEREEIISAEEFHRESNGSLAITEDVMYILISMKTIDNERSNCQYISTIIHELTHLHDFYDFYSINNDKCSNIMEIHKCSDFPPFLMWTEYNARRNGYYFYRKIMNMNNNESEKEQIEYILYKECQFHMKYLKEELIKNQNNPYNFVYNIIQFIGRFSVWNDLFPSDFNVNMLPKELLILFDTRLVKLYEFLYINKNFNDIKYNFNELDRLLSNFVREG